MLRTEMSLHVLAYNFKRVMNLLGIAALIRAIKASKALLRLFRRTCELITTMLSAHLEGILYERSPSRALRGRISAL